MKDSQPTRWATAAELTIATPEGVLFRLPLAGPASRLYAMLLDIAIVLGTVNGVGLLVYWIFAKAPGFGVMVITLAEFAIGFAYGALLEGFWNGQTIGKRLFHLRVIDQAGLPLRLEQAWVLALRIEVGRGGQSEAALDSGAEVGEHVGEQVAPPVA